ncbi:MAG: NADH-quinone oxidoreductase subunit J [Caldilineaceae bacterium]|nr:NADH-quinone oxidoreductase subunit J [Caldilineaceae bacterium]
MVEQLTQLIEQLMAQTAPTIPTIQQVVFVGLALSAALCALMVVLARNLFHSALALVGTLFAVAGIYAMLEAEFLAVSQVLVYVGAISTLITFAIMLTRGMMFGSTSPLNRQAGTATMIISLLFVVLAGLVASMPWPNAAVDLSTLSWGVFSDRGTGEAMIASLGQMFVTTYLVPFELMAVLLLVALAGAILLARDRE